MEVLLALIVGCLYASGLYMMMRRSIFKLIIGLALLSHGSNLLIFMMGRLVRGHPAVIPETLKSLSAPYADPVPQALAQTYALPSGQLRRERDVQGHDQLRSARSRAMPHACVFRAVDHDRIRAAEQRAILLADRPEDPKADLSSHRGTRRRRQSR